MENEELLNQFSEVRECEYKGRRYLVRDNGAICRLPKEGCKASKMDNVWSFGKKDPVNGYMVFSGNIRVHQVVCTAFHGPEPSPHMVVDHIDTNRCNNRPENLRWLTRIENALNNPATRKKIIYLCGSVEAFIENPAIIRTKALPPSIKWMRTVTKEEAAVCKKHIEEWSIRDNTVLSKNSSNEGIGDWIFEDIDGEREKWFSDSSGYKRRQPVMTKEESEEILKSLQDVSEDELDYEGYKESVLYDSLTVNAKQLNWKTPNAFLCCPNANSPLSLETYFDNLEIGRTLSRDNYNNHSDVLDWSYSAKKDAIFILTHKADGVKPYGLCKVFIQDGYYIHESVSTYFEENGARQGLASALGEEWNGPDSVDNYC